MTARPTKWQELLEKALPALEHVFGRDILRPDGVPNWTLGGGTAIAIHLHHRISYDVDLFVAGTPLKRFAPHNNPVAKALSSTYQWPGHYLKYEMKDGEIDFLSPPLQTEPGFTVLEISGRSIPVETPEEVIIKKIRFRSQAFTARDVYDLAAVALERPELPALMQAETGDALDRLAESIRFLEAKHSSRLHDEVVLTAKGKTIIDRAFEIAKATVQTALAVEPGQNQNSFDLSPAALAALAAKARGQGR
jgi:hypothetical protein